MQTGDKNTPFYVGKWQVSPGLNRLSDGNHVIALESRLMETLICLAQSPGRIVSADELLESVWHGRPHADNSVYQAIAQLRKALGDDTHEPRYIETIPKKGYRLICPVVTARSDEKQNAEGRLGFGRLSAVAAAVTAILLLAIVLAVNPDFRNRIGSNRIVPDHRSVAVLPFIDLSKDGSQQYLGDGISEELIHVLSNLPDMRVTARTSSFAFRNSDEDVRKIGSMLNVATVLEGSVRRDDDRIRITTQLVDTKHGYHLWSKSFDRDASDLFEIQSEIAAAVATAFEYPQQHGRSTNNRTAQANELQAYELYLLGLHHMHKAGGGAKYRLAAQYFKRAIEIDPDLARAYAGLAEIYAGWARTPTTDQEALRSAEIAAEQALRLDDQSAPGYYSLGEINFVRRNYADAESAFAKAIEINPNDARAYSRLADTYDMQGRIGDSYQVIKKALQLNPISGELLTKMGNAQYAMTGWDWDSAFSYYQQAMESDPDYPFSYSAVGSYFSGKGQLDQALPYAQKYYSLDESPRWAGASLTSIYRDLGDYDAAMNLVERMRDYHPKNDLAAMFDIHVKLARKEYSAARQMTHKTLSVHFNDDLVKEVMATFEIIVGDIAHAEEIYDRLAAVPGTPNFVNERNLFRASTLGFGTLGAINLAHLHRRNGDTLAADELLRDARDYIESKRNTVFLFPGVPNPLYVPGILHATAQIAAVEGNNEAAIDLFREAVDAGWSKAWYARIDPIMADLRKDPRFVEILDELETRLATMRENVVVLAEN